VRPMIALRETPAVKRGKHRPPRCEHGTWTFAGADPLIPRETPRFTALYRRRASVEREFGRLKNDGRCLRFASVAWIASGCTPT
jgi:hypothetical protein